jgi:hypothetical protein
MVTPVPPVVTIGEFMSKTRVSSIDLETGEILPHVLVTMQRKVPNGFTEGWVAMAQCALEMLAASDLRGDDLRVLLLLLGRLDFENLIQLEQSEIAIKMGMQRPHVNRSMKRLKDLGCILEGPKIGRSRTYRLNPSYGWKGSGKSHQKALRTEEKAKAKGFSVVIGGQYERMDID